MGNLTISRLALAITILGGLVYPATPSLAAPKWLQEMFTVDPPKSQKQKKPRRATAKPAQSPVRITGDVIRLPATAPMPVPAPRDLPAADEIQSAPAPDNKPPQGAPETNLPSQVEAPSDKPMENAEPLDSAPSEPPTPESKPDAPVSQANQAAEPALPAEPPIPEARPDKPEADKPATSEPGAEHEATGAEKAKPDEPPPPPDPRSARRADTRLPDDEAACRWRLTELGVKFKAREEETDSSGCSMPYPIVIENLGTGIDLEPQAEMNCAMAETAARFARDQMSAAAQDVFGASIKSIAHASAFVCRPRNGSLKLSEHAFGNALDIASFTLSNGTVIAVEPTPPEKNADFLAKVRQAACGPFKTVLGPGSDADHAEHFHLDLAPRRNGGTVCE